MILVEMNNEVLLEISLRKDKIGNATMEAYKAQEILWSRKNGYDYNCAPRYAEVFDEEDFDPEDDEWLDSFDFDIE